MNFAPLLEVSGLSVNFSSGQQTTTAVDHVSFILNTSQTLAVVGESGSGKTITALAILGLIPCPPGRILHGSVFFRNSDQLRQNLLQIKEKEMQKLRGKEISMIFQEPMTSLNPVFTCGDQVMESLQVHLGFSRQEAQKKTLDLFNEVLLPRPTELLKTYPHQLSGGQKQRVMIAMAIACNPKILIADEPTTALDVTVQKTILELLKRLQADRKMSILFITHDLGLVSGFADRVLVMNKGKIIEEGTVSEIFNTPRHPYTRGLLACRPPLDKRLNRLPTLENFFHPQPAGHDEIITPRQRADAHKKLYDQKPVLVFESISKQYSSTGSIFKRKGNTSYALKDAKFNVYPGETLGVVGESGSGKTTLARVALELIPASEGRIIYRDTDITRLTGGKLKKFRKEVQIIFQDPYSSLNPRLTIGEAIQEPMKVHKLHHNNSARKEKVMELLSNVGLKPEHYFRYPHEFSGGQRQRICIARALAVEPRLIICDESVSALDVSIQAQVLNLLNDLKRDFGLTYIFISHDLSVVKYMADRLIVMKNGKIVEIGEADQIYAQPQSEYTRDLLEAIPAPVVVKNQKV
ncbi:MAG: ABC transporter ATP-binding protein [Bacteroidales bacterium]|jgi:peptide/nickel transport system ATP-binding protein|nr:ABC transporter ATP-binding protein [Bacteroidales bacterium]